MLNVRLAGGKLHVKSAVHLTVAGGVFDAVSLCCPLSH